MFDLAIIGGGASGLAAAVAAQLPAAGPDPHPHRQRCSVFPAADTAAQAL